MMAMQIRKEAAVAFPKAKPAKNRGYLSFIRELPCCVSGRSGVEAAHLSMAAPQYGHYGRGKSRKASDRWVLPLSREAHYEQHQDGEERFWSRAGINPHVLALTIYGLWTELGEDAAPFAAAIINQSLANTGRLRERADG